MRRGLGLGLAALPGRAACAAAACEGRLGITHAAARPVRRIFWRASALTAWGGDQLRRDLLASDRRAPFRVATPGLCDVRIRFSEGRAVHAA